MFDAIPTEIPKKNEKEERKANGIKCDQFFVHHHPSKRFLLEISKCNHWKMKRKTIESNNERLKTVLETGKYIKSNPSFRVTRVEHTIFSFLFFCFVRLNDGILVANFLLSFFFSNLAKRRRLV